MTPIEQFLWAAIGSTASEVLFAQQFYSRHGRIPVRYTRVGFWVVTAMLATVAGLVVVAHGPSSKLMAIHLGAATPMIIRGFASTPPPAP